MNNINNTTNIDDIQESDKLTLVEFIDKFKYEWNNIDIECPNMDFIKDFKQMVNGSGC